MQLSCEDTFVVCWFDLLGEYGSVTFPNIHCNVETFGEMCELNVSLELKNRIKYLQQEARLNSVTSRQANY